VSDFKAKMHKIRFPLGLRPKPAWGAFSAPTDPLAVFNGDLLLRGGRGRGEGKEGGEWKGAGKGREEEGEYGEGKERGHAPQCRMEH